MFNNFGNGKHMMHLDEKMRGDLARSATAMGKIIEAHADDNDVIRKVVFELPEWVKTDDVRQSVADLWQQNGFVATVTKDGLIIVDGVKDGLQH